MRDLNDTIAAVATANGEGGIAIIRISGKNAQSILLNAFKPQKRGAKLAHGQMLYGSVVDKDGSVADEAMAVMFYAPKSYTREDVAEIHCHGGVSAERTLKICVDLGARPAERGEFTYRAFVNGRLTLDRAEAVMSLISASSERAQRSSLNKLRYGASSAISLCRDRLKELLTLIDACADFPEEMDEDASEKRVRTEAEEILAMLGRVADERYLRITTSGASVVIAGRPNVGKSSIMNRLLSNERSIVTEIPGTTRDLINESCEINGIRLTLTDTAGIRQTNDIIESMGVDRAKNRVESADCVLLVMDASRQEDDEDRQLLKNADDRYILIANKDDIKLRDIPNAIKISAATGKGFDKLSQVIYEKISVGEDDDKLLSLRHIKAAQKAREALMRLTNLPQGTELDLMREDLYEALTSLGEITGENIGEAVIDGIFATFCVGK